MGETSKEMTRRQFVKKAAVGVTAGAVLGSKLFQPSMINAQTTFSWRMVTAWPPGFPALQEGAVRLARQVEAMTQGRMRIRVFAAGELLPGLGGFEAVRAGTVEMNHAAAYFWAGVVPHAQFFTTVPFGMSAQQMNAWIYTGGGLELWHGVYRPFNLIAFPIANTGMQMAGWFRREINTVGDLRGLRMRIPGLGARVLAKAGGSPVLLPAGEIFTALERGVVDAAEFVGPIHDLRLGLHRARAIYYSPGWHEPQAMAEIAINLEAWNRLPADIQEAIKAAASEVYVWSSSRIDTMNAQALREIQAAPGVRVRRLPREVLRELRRLTIEVLDEEAGKSPEFRRVLEAYNRFRRELGGWSAISEEVVVDLLRLR
jgi:TRAP-type mannitol/chloroaromatic compound transport system substrate-binding protein